MGDHANDIINELKTKFDRHSIWVWFDKTQQYEGILDEIEAALEPEGVTVARYDGSYLALKRRLRDEDPDVEGKWLFYIPESDTEADWFRDVQSMAREYRVTDDIDNTPVAKFLVEREAEIPGAFEDWGQSRSAQQTAFFCVLFDTTGPDVDSWVRSYLADPEAYRDPIESYAMADAWENRLRETFGVDAGLDATEIATQLLFGEVTRSAPTNRYEELAADDERAASEFVEEWQKDTAHKDTFARYSRDIGANYDLANAVVESGNVRWEASAFEAIDDGLITLVMEQLAEETYATLPQTASQLKRYVDVREEQFWNREGIVDWSVPKHAVDALASIHAQETTEASNMSPRELATAYTDDDGWWTVDAAYREFIDATQKTAYPYPKETTVKQRVTKQYMTFLKTVNRPLASPLSDDPSLGTPQSEFFEQFGEPEEGTVVIICDGLRYELAEKIRQRLDQRGEFEQDLSAFSAVLPSITEVGMAAHLPGHLGLGLNDDELTVSVGGDRMRHKGDRDEILNTAGYEVTSLNDIGDTSLEDLQESDPIPRAVYSETIDKLGEGLDDDDAFSRVASHIDDVERAIYRLKQAGYTKFIVTSDHGFLYTTRLSDGLKVEAPDLAATVKRRFAVAEDSAPLIEAEEYVTVDADALDSLGIDAEGIKLIFPRSVACFKARGGNMRYFHGGISLQELLVPCLQLTTEELEESASINYDVTAPDPITNSIVSVKISAKSEQLSFDGLTLEIRATVGDSPAADPVEKKITQGENSAQVNLKQGVIGGESEVEFQIINTETRETIDRRTVKLDLLFGDEDMGFDV